MTSSGGCRRQERAIARSGTVVPPLLLFAAVLLLYVISLDSDVGFWDTGEMNGVPYILGLAHPTGYPTEILVGWLFSHAFVFGDVAFRLTLLNAIEAALSAVVLYLFVRLEGVSIAVGASIAVAFASTPLVWLFATHTDVTNLAVILVATALLLLRIWQRTKDARALIGAALAGGLALGTHGAALTYLAAAGTGLFLFRPRPQASLVIAGAIALCAVTAAVYCYLPVRANIVIARGLDPTSRLGLSPGSPIWDWGDPRDARNLLRVVSGADVRAASSVAPALSLDRIPHDAAFAWQALVGALGMLPLIALLSLCAIGCFRDWRCAFILALPTIYVTLFVANFPGESDPSRYYLLPIWGLYAIAALGMDWIARRWRGRVASAAVVTAVLALAFTQTFANRVLFQQTHDAKARNYMHAVLALTPGNAVIVAQWTYATPLA